jgi:hypothetical protein
LAFRPFWAFTTCSIFCEISNQRRLPVSVHSAGGRFGLNDDGQTPNTQATTFSYADGSIMTFEVRNLGSFQEFDGKNCGNSFFGTKGFYVVNKGFYTYKDGTTDQREAIAVTHIAEVERWPSDACVITDLAHVTPWWSEVGAIGVIALATTPEQGAAACQRGATKWLPRDCTIPTLVAAFNALCTSEQERPFPPAKRAQGVSETRRVRIVKPVAGILDGVSLSTLAPGLIYDLEASLAHYLISCGAAEESAAARAVSVVPEDDPYIAHLVGGVIVTQAAASPRQHTAADKPPKVRLHKRKVKRR